MSKYIVEVPPGPKGISPLKWKDPLELVSLWQDVPYSTSMRITLPSAVAQLPDTSEPVGTQRTANPESFA